MIDRVTKGMGRHPLARYLVVAGVCGLAGGVAGGVTALTGGTSPAQMGLSAVVVAAAMGIGLVVCGWWWKGLDEAAREAHKWAWWWGSTFGLALGGVGLLTLLGAAEGDGGASLFAGQAPIDLLFLGVFAVVGVQALGYLIAWAIWWLQRR